MSDNLEARLEAAKRFTSATRSEAAAAMVTAANLVEVERVIAAELPTLRTKAPASPPATTAVAPQPGGVSKVTEEQYGAMSAAERFDYCRRFPQPLDHGRRR